MKTFKILLPYLKGKRLLIALALFLALASSTSKLILPFLAGRAIDQIRSGNLEIAPYLFAMLGCLLAGMLFRYCFDLLTSVIGQRVVKGLRDDVYRSISGCAVSYLDTHSHGDLLQRLVSDIENVQNGLIVGALSIFEGVVQILITIALMFYLNWVLGLVVVLLSPLSIFVSRFISSRNSRYFKTQSAVLGGLTAYSLETIDNLGAIASYGLSETKKEAFEEENGKMRQASFKAIFAACWINPATRLVNNIIYGSVVLLGAMMLCFPASFSWMGIAFTVGSLSSFLTYSYQYMAPFNEVADASSELFYASASLRRIEEVLHAEKDIDEGTISLDEEVKGLKADHIVFSYDKKRRIIDDFDLEIYRGHKIALVGPTGCGKTTVINLLMRFYDPDSGSFQMNDKPIPEYRKASVRRHIGMVLQETWLKHGTIAENIALGKEGATREEIVEAARKARADGFIRRLKDGYDTVVSNASALSMGEKQLLCVARIMLASPEIVLLDEATSSIDLRTEIALSGAFDELMGGKTSLVVAHRLSTIENADLILVMKDGKIIEQGNFGELLDKNGFFAELYRAQFA